MKARSLLTISSAGIVIGVCLFADPHEAFAAGTALDVQSGRGTGMASAQTALVDDSSAIYFNAAGIARGKVLDAQAGITLIAPSFNYKDTAGNKTSMPFYVVPPLNAYVSGGITDNLSVGIGVFTPYGLDIKWPDGWVGRSTLTKASLRTFYFNPTVAYRYGPVRVGVGFQLVRSTVELHRDIRFGVQDGSTDLAGGGWGVGVNGGVQVDAIEKYLTVGVHYRSAVKINYEGNAHFNNVPTSLQTTIFDQPVSTSFVHPDQLAIGLASHPIERLALDFDLVWYGWGKLRSIDIEFPNDRSGQLAIHEAKNWSSGLNYHLGAEGTIDDHWKVRGGVLYDPSPSPQDTLAADIPDAHRLNLAVGGSYHHDSGIRVDVGYQFLVLFSRKTTFAPLPGEYGGIVNILGLSVGYTMPLGKQKPKEPPPPEPAPTTPQVAPLEPPPASPPTPAPPP